MRFSRWCSGLSTAKALIDRGEPVTVLEHHPVLAGLQLEVFVVVELTVDDLETERFVKRDSIAIRRELLLMEFAVSLVHPLHDPSADSPTLKVGMHEKMRVVDNQVSI